MFYSYRINYGLCSKICNHDDCLQRQSRYCEGNNAMRQVRQPEFALRSNVGRKLGYAYRTKRHAQSLNQQPPLLGSRTPESLLC
ncbi:hypothetical protein AMS68_002168 [Peltaster fructicola]|uniref:Uncharacterized protein n=1 Tax=Peltaster fructicola TaxID=286661 RepID=A0A6H0XPS4_9PEZI|nr:hypothetical protein AMS68_002168 [Peltaster fructicola]